MDLRKLDSLVAEHVMGFNNIGKRDIPGSETYQMFEYQKYSTDIAAAWDVVEKLRLDAIWLQIKPNIFGFKIDCCPVPGVKIETAADNAPLAICLAALKAKGIDVSEWEK